MPGYYEHKKSKQNLVRVVIMYGSKNRIQKTL